MAEVTVELGHAKRDGPRRRRAQAAPPGPPARRRLRPQGGDRLHSRSRPTSLDQAIRHGVRVVDLKADGKTEKALIHEVQWDHLGKDMLHVDFTRVAADERVVVTVPIELRGIAPGVTAGGVLDQPLHTLHGRVPGHQRARLDPREHRRAADRQASSTSSDLTLPEGVKAMARPGRDRGPGDRAGSAEAEPAAAGRGRRPAEPEVIGRKAKAEEEEARRGQWSAISASGD